MRYKHPMLGFLAGLALVGGVTWATSYFNQFGPSNGILVGTATSAATSAWCGTLNAQSGTTYTLALTDANQCVTMSNAGNNTVTVPTNATVAFPIGSRVNIQQLGATPTGATTISPAVGVTFTNITSGAALSPLTQNGTVILRKTGTDTWNVDEVSSSSAFAYSFAANYVWCVNSQEGFCAGHHNDFFYNASAENVDSTVTYQNLFAGNAAVVLVKYQSNAGAIAIQQPSSTFNTSHCQATAAGGTLPNFTDPCLWATGGALNLGSSQGTEITLGNVSAGDSGIQLYGALIDQGEIFSATGCSISSTTGGAASGTFTLGAHSCNVTITPANVAAGVTSPHGWTCDAHDQTAPTVLIGGESSSNTTTATIPIPAGAGTTDVISFHCMGY